MVSGSADPLISPVVGSHPWVTCRERARWYDECACPPPVLALDWSPEFVAGAEIPSMSEPAKLPANRPPAGSAVVIAGLQDHDVVAVDQVDEPVLLADPS
jgi:hypothetical protein